MISKPSTNRPNPKTQFLAQRWPLFALSAALLLTLLLPLNLLTLQPFHHDEALYATWAWHIAFGGNPWLSQVPLDKPPLFLYAVAGAMKWLGPTEVAARIPSLLATAGIVGFTFYLGRAWYGLGVGLLAAWLLALSPFMIAFAPTALTDPLMVALILASCVLLTQGRVGWAGVCLGLAIATKQQGVFFLPLLVLLLGLRYKISRAGLRPLGTLLLLTALITTLVFWWDGQRGQSPGFWQMSLINYGGVSLTSLSILERGREFITLLSYGTASPVLNWIFLLGLPFLLLNSFWYLINHPKSPLTPQITTQSPPRPISQSPNLPLTDWLLTLFCLLFLAGHIFLSFQVWDRYLLGIVPFLALLLARILLWPWLVIQRLLRDQPAAVKIWSERVAGVLLVTLVFATLAQPVQDVVNARYPLGSNSAGLEGIEQLAAYLQGQVGANHTLHHQWLGTHWRFYLAGFPYDLQYWSTPEMLARKAQPDHLIVFPAWHSETEVRLALAEVNLTLVPLRQVYSSVGYPSLTLYQIEAAEDDRP